MNERDFFSRFISLLENTKERYELDNIHDALILWFGENYLSLDPEEVKERIVQDKHAEGIDAVLIDQRNYNLFFIQAKTVTTFENTKNNFSENDVKLALEGIRFLVKGDYKGKITPELENLIDEYHELDKTGNYTAKALFLTLMKEPIDNKYIQYFKKDFSKVGVDFYNFEWLFDFYVNSYLPMRAAPPRRISFEVLTNLLTKDSPNKSRVFTCKGKELAKIYNDHREAIFQQNVRYSLGLRPKSINRQILETATDTTRDVSFWYFNNGITIVCKTINEATSGKVINLDEAQIINGAQTTYALYEAYKNGNLKDNVEVLVKTIESNNRDFIESVTLYTNSQNAIRLRDLCSKDAIQSKIQKILLDSYKYFYERARGEFESLYPTPEAKEKLLGRNYKNKIINNENAAQAFLALYLNKPAQAKSEKGRIFMKDTAGFYDDIFKKNDDIIPEKILMSWKLLKYIETQKKEYKKQYKIAEDLPEDKRKEIYKYDFLLHSEYFILNLFKDSLRNGQFDIDSKKDELLAVIKKIDANDTKVLEYYKDIKDLLAEYIDDRRIKPGYYHNKFFKNEQSIALVRNFFNQKHDFIEVMPSIR
ncbi:MAG TPA: AIPR family protein [Candidatus Wunengus californicus]|uniref:AIPR family protein n=1 Tax=Candidatus Wunengus californicus TaxID=3367619 RepID=UPI0040279580